MPGLGTLINVAAILLAGLLGSLLGKILQPHIQEGLMKATGLCVLFIGLAGSMEHMLSIQSGALTSGGSMLLIGCFSLGTLLGAWLNIEGRLEQFGAWLKVKTGSQQDSGFVGAFVDATMTVCIGAMAVVGSLEDGIAGDHSLLVAKAVLDFIIIFVMTSSLGRGCAFAAIPVGIFQGIITLLARFIAPVMTADAQNYLSLTGSILIFAVGVNLIWGKKLPVANMLPTLVFAVIAALFV